MLSELLSIMGLAGRVCAGLVFILAAADKILHWRVLEGVIRNYRLLPDAMVKPAAYLLPPVELAVGCALLSGMLLVPAAGSAMALLLLFAVAMAVNIRRGRHFIDCGCHQSFLRQTLRPALVVRNLILTAMLAPGLFGLQIPSGGASVGLAAGVALFLFYLLGNTIAALPGFEASPERAP
jgi:hypothetical protein